MRGAVVQGLAQPPTAADLGRLIETLQHDHEHVGVLSGVLQALASVPGDAAAPMIELLGHPSANLRMHAALVLGHLENRDAVPALVRVLDDDDANVRFHAIEALGRLRAIEAVAPLAILAASGDFFLAFPAIDALGCIDDPAVLPTLVALLDEGMLRSAAVDALGALAHPDAVAPLVERLNAGDVDASAVAVALERIHQRATVDGRSAAPVAATVRRALSPAGIAHLTAALARGAAPMRPLAVTLGWAGGAALPALVAAVGDPTGDDRETQQAIADAIVAIGTEAVPPLLERLQSGERETRAGTTAILGRLTDPRSVPALIELLRTADEEMAITAAAALARIGDARALEPLLSLFAAASAPLRHQAVAAVIAIDAPGTEGIVLARLADADRHVRECAVRVMAASGFAAASSSIVRALEDEHEEVRRAAIDGLRAIDPPQAVGRLLAALGQETARNRAAAAHALRAVAADTVAGAEEGLIAALADADAWVRYFAADSLASHGRTAAVAALTALFATEAATHVRIAALRTLAGLDAAAAVRVASASVDATDPDLANAALAVMAGRGDRG